MAFLRWVNHWSTYVFGGLALIFVIFIAIEYTNNPPIAEAYPRNMVAEVIVAVVLALMVTFAARIVIGMFRFAFWGTAVLMRGTSEDAAKITEAYRNRHNK